MQTFTFHQTLSRNCISLCIAVLQRHKIKQCKMVRFIFLPHDAMLALYLVYAIIVSVCHTQVLYQIG